MAITFGDRVFKGFSFIVPLGVACSTFGAANGSAFTAARISYAAAKNRHFPKFISYLSQSRYTPLMAVMFNCTMATIMVIPPASTVSSLVDYFSFAMWTIHALTFISIIVFRFKEPYKHFERPFKVILYYNIPLL